MDTWVLRIFQKEIERQCKFALIAEQDLKAALPSHEFDRIWYSIQAFLVAVGNISRILWPIKPLLVDRGAEIRKSLFVDDNSPLEPRKFRNHFEHFDERLENWASSSSQSPIRGFIDSNVGPPVRIMGCDQNDYHTNFDTTTFAVTFRGDLYVLPPIFKAVNDLWQKAVVEANKLPNE